MLAWTTGPDVACMTACGARPGGQEMRVTTLDRWIEAACTELELQPGDCDVRLVLDLARDAAHQVERPAAPVTSFLLGLAVGRGGSMTQGADRLRALAAAWAPADTD
jgi:hypothetical protein